MTNDLLRLVEFWGLTTVMFGLMLIMAWRFRIGDSHMIRRTSIYFVSVFIALPGLTLLLFTVSESTAKAIFVPLLILGTVVYLIFTILAIVRPKA